MEKVRVGTAVPYDVLIGKELTAETVSRITDNCKKVILLWDEAVFSGYVAEIGNALEKEGKEVYCIEMGNTVAAKGNLLYRISMNHFFQKPPCS